MMRLAILGSTGSIGTQTLEVARWHGHRVVALAAGRNSESILRQAHEFCPELVAVDEAVADEVRERLPGGTRIVFGAEGL
ncbi:MAG TPA: 1-deoxy-D-xylulose-5-phosphate reductoisomerase, partial [Trueperaceae bacterium]|nr:1-deoxy-D-xylulose-5-phosphate reductoisomerase [Trueperaceae bacterium]